jgi:hypothetical protein
VLANKHFREGKQSKRKKKKSLIEILGGKKDLARYCTDKSKIILMKIDSLHI